MKNFTKNTIVAYIREQVNQQRNARVFAQIEYKDGNLSICGVIGPNHNGDAFGICGQIFGHWKEWDTREGVDLAAFVDVWERYHLNDMHAGTPLQTARLKQLRGEKSEGYDKDCELLEKSGLLTDNGYTYGHRWLKIEVPEAVLEFLKSLPDDTAKLPTCWNR